MVIRPSAVCGRVAELKVLKADRKVVVELEPDVREEGGDADVNTGKRPVFRQGLEDRVCKVVVSVLPLSVINGQGTEVGVNLNQHERVLGLVHNRRACLHVVVF